MSVSSTVAPKTVELIKIDGNNQAYYKLRKNIIPTTSKDDLTGISENLYVYDETDIQITYVENQINIILGDFNNYWTLGVNQETERKILLENQEKMKVLVDGGQFQQLLINADVANSTNTLLLGLLDVYNQILNIPTKQ